MASEVSTRVRVDCTECPFSKVVEKREEKPADVIVEHGKETGHTLTVGDVEGDD